MSCFLPLPQTVSSKRVQTASHQHHHAFSTALVASPMLLMQGDSVAPSSSLHSSPPLLKEEPLVQHNLNTSIPIVLQELATALERDITAGHVLNKPPIRRKPSTPSAGLRIIDQATNGGGDEALFQSLGVALNAVKRLDTPNGGLRNDDEPDDDDDDDDDDEDDIKDGCEQELLGDEQLVKILQSPVDPKRCRRKQGSTNVLKVLPTDSSWSRQSPLPSETTMSMPDPKISIGKSRGSSSGKSEDHQKGQRCPSPCAAAVNHDEDVTKLKVPSGMPALSPSVSPDLNAHKAMKAVEPALVELLLRSGPSTGSPYVLLPRRLVGGSAALSNNSRKPSSSSPSSLPSTAQRGEVEAKPSFVKPTEFQSKDLLDYSSASSTIGLQQSDGGARPSTVAGSNTRHRTNVTFFDLFMAQRSAALEKRSGGGGAQSSSVESLVRNVTCPISACMSEIAAWGSPNATSPALFSNVSSACRSPSQRNPPVVHRSQLDIVLPEASASCRSPTPLPVDHRFAPTGAFFPSCVTSSSPQNAKNSIRHRVVRLREELARSQRLQTRRTVASNMGRTSAAVLVHAGTAKKAAESSDDDGEASAAAASEMTRRGRLSLRPEQQAAEEMDLLEGWTTGKQYDVKSVIASRLQPSLLFLDHPTSDGGTPQTHPRSSLENTTSSSRVVHQPSVLVGRGLTKM